MLAKVTQVSDVAHGPLVIISISCNSASACDWGFKSNGELKPQINKAMLYAQSF
jgi:hypothetical protein